MGLSVMIICLSSQLYAQISWKNWNSLQFTASVTRKLDVRISHLESFSLSGGFSREFNQSTAQVGYEVSRHWDLSGGYTFGGSASLTDGGSRIFARAAYKIPLAGLLSWSNSLQTEVHDAAETRYHYRFILHSRLSTRKRLDFLRLSPSVSYSLFYNLGGSPVQYYDMKTGAPTVSQTPDGFHRGRLMFSLNSKLSNNFSLSAYFMAQREFNFLTGTNQAMNVTRPTNGRIQRPFDNYNVAGLTLQYELKCYKHR